MNATKQPTVQCETPVITVRISNDGLQAVAVSDSSSSGLGVGSLRAALEAQNIHVGVSEDQFPTVLSSPGTEIVVAVGRQPIKGQDGWIERFEPQAGSRSDALVKRPSANIWGVRQGDKVAIIHPPSQGTDGMTVHGNVIPASIGTEAAATLGVGVEWSKETKGLILATVNGRPNASDDGLISVEEKIEIHDDLDFASGSVDYPGSLVILGDITGEITVRVGGDLEVRGDVGDAAIEASGNVLLQRGFLGRGTGIIRAGGTVRFQHLLNQTVVAGTDIFIDREAVNGTIQAGRRIHATNAQITGGTIEAEELIEVGSIGRTEGSQTKIRVGRRGKVTERLGVVEKELKQAEKNQVEVKDAVYKLVLLKINSKVLPPEREQLLTRLQQTQKLLPTTIESLKKEIAELSAELSKNVEAKLKVFDTIHDNIFIDINGARKLTDSALSGVVFAEHAGEVEATGL